MSTTPTNTKRKLHRCKRCGYFIINTQGLWRIDEYNEDLKYQTDMNAYETICRSGDIFSPHVPEEKSDNFKLIYDILNEDN